MKTTYNEWLEMLKNELNGQLPENSAYYNWYVAGMTPKQIANYLTEEPQE